MTLSRREELGKGETVQGPAAVLWDMDGTIVDTEPLWLAAETEMLDRFGITMTAETHRMLIGSGLTDAARHFQELGVPLSVQEIVDGWVAGVSRGLKDTGPDWRPGARELLLQLQESGVPCALVTMSVRLFADQVADLLPEGTFSAIIAGDEVTHEKPHPEPYLLGAQALGVPIEQCLVLEDSPTGLKSAAASGAVAIGVPNLLTLEDAPSHEIWSTLDGVTSSEVCTAFDRLRPTRLPESRLVVRGV